MSRITILSGARRARGGAAALLLLSAACNDDSRVPLGPTEEPVEITEAAADIPLDDTIAEPLELDAGAAVTLERRSSRPGLAFGSWGMSNEQLDQVHTGWMASGAISPKNIINRLSGTRARGGRVVVKLSRGGDRHVKNRDGSFSLEKWKSQVNRYRKLNLAPFIKDGTIIAHYLIDEPHRAKRWGGRAIPYKTLEEMARYSKQLWPDMHTVIRVAPSWLAGAPFRWKHLDAGWAQYRATHGSAARWIASEANAAEREGLGLVVGLNVLDGGNGSSRIRGNSRRKWAMSGKEIRSYGTAMLGTKRACGFFSWTHERDYYDRSEVRSAMAEVSRKARSHAKTSCKQK